MENRAEITFQAVMRLGTIMDWTDEGRRIYAFVGDDRKTYCMEDVTLDDKAVEYLVPLAGTSRRIYVCGHIVPCIATKINLIIDAFAECVPTKHGYSTIYVPTKHGYSTIDPKTGEESNSLYVLTNQK